MDGQRVLLAREGQFKGEGEARDLGSVPLGYEVEAQGRRRGDGALLATSIQAT